MTVPIDYACSRGDDIEIDWGDGSAPETVSGSGAINTTHNYAPGKYVLTLFNKGAGYFWLGNSGNAYAVVGRHDPVITSCLYKAELADGLAQLYGAFRGCVNMQSVSMAKSVRANITTFNGTTKLDTVVLAKGQTTIATNAFPGSGVKKICLPYGFASTASTSCEGASCLGRIHYPEGFTSLGNNTHSGNRGLTEVTLPSTVTSIGSYAFNNCSAMTLLKFLATTPPTVSNGNAFNGLNKTCIVEVPAESLEAYQNETNYSGIAAQMIGV
jgi:hypothetical protein